MDEVASDLRTARMSAVPMTLAWDAIAGPGEYHVALVRIPPGGPSVLPHSHCGFHELITITAGIGWHATQGRIDRIGAGDVVFVAESSEHSLGCAKDDTALTFINIAFPRVAFEDFATAIGLVDSIRVLSSTTHAYDSTGRSRVAAADLMRRFQVAANRVDLVRYLSDALPVMLRASEPTRSLDGPAWFSNACVLMEQEQHLRAGVQHMATLAGVTPGHLARVCQEYRGCTPTELVNRLRAEHAATLLGTTSDSMSRIAQRCGFSSQSYFNRVFAARFAISPGVFRRRPVQAVAPRMSGQ